MAVAALLMLSAYFVPLWQILMWAPQYPEWLKMQIWINDISGDINTINGLNHYIGMKLIKPEMFPEFEYMGTILGVMIGLGLLMALINRFWSLVGFLLMLLAAGAAALYDFYQWGYDYGHNLDPNAAIQVPGMSYQPPVIGTKQLLNFTAFSGPDVGGWIFVGIGALLIALVVLEGFVYKKAT